MKSEKVKPEATAKVVRKPRAPAKAKTPAGKQTIPPEQRLHMIANAAYLRAEQRGFQGGDAMQDWLAAEAEVDMMLGSTKH